PYLREKWNLSLLFDTLDLKFSAGELENDRLSIHGLTSVQGLIINHPRIAAENVILNNSTISYRINLSENGIELDSASMIRFNKLVFNPYISCTLYPGKQFSVKIHKDKFQAQDLFESLPSGLFSNLAGIKTQGELSYHLNFFVDMSKPDSLILESDLKKFNFRINHFGNTDFNLINDTFTYTAYEKGLPVRRFQVGEKNSNFRKLYNISDYLKNAVMISEDGGFYNHRGFLMDAMKESIAENIKKERFARGGSTISMQLVKNVFLSRNKTIARKAEEILIVWLIENNNISTKDRMYEVYLNIIEWGPLIYGANEASRFYFNKDVSQLSLNEAIFMASIIPRPKWFMYSFDKYDHLRDYLVSYYHLVSSKMLRKEMISQEEFDNLICDVKLKGKAESYLSQIDSISPDSIEIVKKELKILQ
ncbi:MAG: transglycosylase domain-containing protein, partial [Bacteroidia bacterium]|nr:transglycosylase domain-containing protein [Bacteroidia bacterium]